MKIKRYIFLYSCSGKLPLFVVKRPILAHINTAPIASCHLCLYSLISVKWIYCQPLRGMVMQQHPTHKSELGFTLIEMLIVIAIIGILASIVVTRVSIRQEYALV